jgi:hypothetical protein
VAIVRNSQGTGRAIQELALHACGFFRMIEGFSGCSAPLRRRLLKDSCGIAWFASCTASDVRSCSTTAEESSMTRPTPPLNAGSFRPIACAAALLVLTTIAASSCSQREAPAGITTTNTRSTERGTIRGHVRLTASAVENELIRMNADPMCAEANRGKRVSDTTALVAADGSLGNVLVQLQGEFPDAPARTDAVLVDQVGCVYLPRVVGLQVGQPLQVRNSDPGLHNVHGTQAGADGFNVGQPVAGIVNTFKPASEGVLRLRCDVHGWMVAFVGVVRHPYFAVTGVDGTFELRDVPRGSQTIQAWHERYGVVASTVQVEADGVTEVDFTYPAAAQ